MFKFISSRKFLANRLVFILPLGAWGLYLRFKERALQDLWTDEKWQIAVMNQPFFDFVKSLQKREFAGLLAGDSILIYPFFQMFGDNKWGLAIPHIIATFVGFYLLYLLCRKYLQRTFSCVIVFLIICLNQELIFHSFEIRTYAVLPTLAVGSFCLMHKLFIQETPMRRSIFLWIQIFFIFTIWWHLYGIFMIIFPWLYFAGATLSSDGLRVVLKKTTRALAPALLVALPLCLFSIFGEKQRMVFTYMFQFIPNPLENIVGFLKAIFGNLVGDKRLYVLLLGPVLAALLPHPDRYKQIGFFLCLVVLPITLLLAIDAHSQYWFVQRQFVWVIPYFALYVGWCWESSVIYLLRAMAKSDVPRQGLVHKCVSTDIKP